MGYRLIDHTADLGIEVWEPDGPQLFIQSALAMFELLCPPATVQASRQSKIQVNGKDWPDLMVNWLRELLYFWTGRHRLVRTITMGSFKAYAFTADVAWEKYDPPRHPIRHEIKAVTYHQIAAGPTDGGIREWRARIIFDL